MQMQKFIKVRTNTGFFIIPIDRIVYVSPYDKDTITFKSTIKMHITEGSLQELYCIESQEEIYNKINAAQR